MGGVKEACLLVPGHQSSVASGQFGLDFQESRSFEGNIKLLNSDILITMSKRPIMIATAQSYISADIRENGREIRKLMRQASEEGAVIVHFPEGAMSGYTKSQI